MLVCLVQKSKGCSYLRDLLVTHTSIHNIVMIIIVELLRGDGMML